MRRGSIVHKLTQAPDRAFSPLQLIDGSNLVIVENGRIHQLNDELIMLKGRG